LAFGNEDIFGFSESTELSRRRKKKFIQFGAILTDLLPFKVRTRFKNLLDDHRLYTDNE